MSDTEFKRLLQPASSTGYFSQRDKTVGINDRAVDDNSDSDVLAVAVFLFVSVGSCPPDTNNPVPPRLVRCSTYTAVAVQPGKLFLPVAVAGITSRTWVPVRP